MINKIILYNFIKSYNYNIITLLNKLYIFAIIL